MIDVNIRDLVPRFILQDKNGAALAKGIEAALTYAVNRMDAGLGWVQDVDTMPEWRLDDMAWEYACIYNYNADVETKREWIRNAPPYSRVLGTSKCVWLQLIGYFNEVEVQEWFDYGGEPFHFKVQFRADKNVTTLTDWVYQCIEQSQNERSVLDTIVPTSDTVLVLKNTTPARIPPQDTVPKCGMLACGGWPLP